MTDPIRAALAQPAPPAEHETEDVTDQELLEVLDRATANFSPNHLEVESMTGVSYALALEVRKARAVLARWGRPATHSAEELIQSYQAGRRDSEADAQQAAEAAEDRPVTGEVAELVAALREIVEVYQSLHASGHIWKVSLGPSLTTDTLSHAADLLEQQATAYAICERERLHQSTRAADLEIERHPAPVPVSERMPGPEDCDGEGRCWFSPWHQQGYPPSWRLIEPYLRHFSDAWWLPAHALPLPATEPQP